MTKKKGKLYLSGPMTGMPLLNKPAFNKAAKLLRQQGYRVVNPPELDRVSPQRTWEGCLKRDIVKLLECDKVANLPNWKKSKGATLENYIAKALSFEIHPVRYYL